MKILDYLLQNLGSSVKNIQIKNELRTIPDTIILLDGHTPVRPGSICIGEQREILYTIKNFTTPKDMVFFVPNSKNHGLYSKLSINIVETTMDLITLYNKLNNAMSTLNRIALQSDSEMSPFDLFFHNIVSMKLTDDEEIRSSLYELPFNSTAAYNIIVIEPADKEGFRAEFKEVRDKVLEIFPTSNTTFFYNRLVVMYHSAPRTVKMPTDKYEELTKVLAKYDAYAGVSNHTHNFEMIRTEYIIAKSILQISKTMFGHRHSRIFTQEEYGSFYMLDLCYRQYEQIFHHNNILYLAHPGLAALIRYDSEHSTNLREILLNYLLNDRSLARTSELLFMHRNTAMNKINKIKEIVEDDWDDPLIRQRLLFSCMLYDYCEKYKQRDMKVLPVTDDEELEDGIEISDEAK